MKLNHIFYLFLSLLVLSCSDDDASNSNILTGRLANQLSAGQSSNDLLSANRFTSMVVEVVYVEGFEPTQAAINHFTSFLEDRTFKPDGITVEKRAIASPGLASYTINDIIAIEDANRTRFNTGNQIAVWAFFADAESASNSGSGVVLGTAYRNTSFVIFEETISSFSDEPLEPSRNVLESVVIEHEFGHILGLTNLGAPLQSNHEDGAHPKHCNVEDCLMYWTAETGSGIIDMVSGGNIPTLDAQCIADLQANGGR